MVYCNLKYHLPANTGRRCIHCAADHKLTGSIDGRRPSLIKIRALTVVLLFLSSFYCAPGMAQDSFGDFFSIQSDSSGGQETYLYTSLYTRHYDPDPDHVNHQNVLGFESETRVNRLWGLAIFDNSFGQESQYLYLGQKWRAFKSDRWYYKLTAGLLHGYKEPYDDKIPLNDLGVAPAIIPALGYRHKSFFVEFTQLGLAAGMVTAGFVF